MTAFASRHTLDDRIATFDRVCVLTARSGQPLDIDEMNSVRRLIQGGTTNPDKVFRLISAKRAASEYAAHVYCCLDMARALDAGRA